MEKIYNKLVRDRIPEIIASEGKTLKTKILSKEEFLIELFNKAGEEAAELIAARGNRAEVIKEIGDVQEVLDAIIDSLSLDREEIKRLKNERKEKRGAFKERIFLESVKE